MRHETFLHKLIQFLETNGVEVPYSTNRITIEAVTGEVPKIAYGVCESEGVRTGTVELCGYPAELVAA